jgi:hypothetical protein
MRHIICFWLSLFIIAASQPAIASAPEFWNITGTSPGPIRSLELPRFIMAAQTTAG